MMSGKPKPAPPAAVPGARALADDDRVTGAGTMPNRGTVAVAPAPAPGKRRRRRTRFVF